MRKFTRILLKSLMYLAIVILLLVTSLFFLVKTSSFQTWLAQKATTYLSKELATVIKIDKVDIEFFKAAHLNGVYIEDKTKDTLFSGGNIVVELNLFDYEFQKVNIRNVTLENATAKLAIHKKDSVFNFQFLIDHFSSNDTIKDTTKSGWDVTFNELTLKNINFQFINENKKTTITSTINFNNLRADNLSGKFSQININKDTIGVVLSNLRFNEQSGFQLVNLSSALKISEKELYCEYLEIVTPGTNLKGRLHFKYDSWDDYSDFINKVNMDVHFRPKSKIYLKDIASFTEELDGLKDTIKLSGKIKGFVSDLNLTDFKLKLKDHTEFIGDLSMIGLPDFNNSFLHLDAKKLSTSYSDLIQIPNYPFKENKKLAIPIELKSLGIINYTGKFDGLINDFNIYGTLRTKLGSVLTDIGIKTGKKADDIIYHGKIKTSNFNIGALVGVPGLSNLGVDVKLNGSGISIDKIDATMEGQIKSLFYNGYNYSNIKVDGTFFHKSFNGLLVSTDPNADFDFNGNINFTGKLPQMDFISTVNKLDLKKLNFTKEEAQFSTQILINLSGDNLNNLTGNINFDNTFYKNSEKTYKISTFDLNLNQANAIKNIHLSSNYFNLDVDGLYSLTNLPFAFKQTLNTYYPTFVSKNKGKTLYKDAFKFKLTIKKFDIVNELFVKSLMVSPNTSVVGDFDAAKNLFNFNLKSTLIEASGVKFNNNVIESYSQNNKINLVFKGSNIQLTDSIKLNNYFMYLVSKDQDTKYNLEWDDKNTPNTSGKIAGKVSFTNNQAIFAYSDMKLTVKDSTWKMVTSNPSIIDTTGTILVNPLQFKNNDQSIDISGAISNKQSDSVNLVTRNLVLDQFNPILSPLKIKLSGKLNGRVKLQNIDNHLSVNSFLDFSKFKFNDNVIGRLVIRSDYIPKEKRLEMDGYTSLGISNDFGFEVKNVAFKGNYYTEKKEESIDLTFTASPLNIKLLNPLLEGILTIKSGFVNGGGKIHGTPDNILIEGELNLFKSEIKIDYTNVTYNITGKIEIMPDQIRFNDLLMTELYLKSAPQGTLNGNIFHSNFKRMQLDYDLTYRNMLLLNTTANENKDFYGKIYGSGNIGIWGFINNINMQVRDTSGKNSKFILPLDGPEEIADNDFIHFVKKDTVKAGPRKHLTGFNLDLNIVATPELTTHIIFDQANNDEISIYGNGEIAMKINTYGKFDMFGDYIISGGDYNFSLEKVINKHFDIDAGSSIMWSGNPLNGDIDITASYRQRASIAPLINDATGAYKARTPAACKLKMKNKLMNPDISFALEFPNIADNIRSQINNVLTDEQELNRQVFSFLLFRSFVPPLIYNTTGGGVTAGNAAASTGSELLSNKLSNVLDGMVGNFTKDLQVGVNYRPGSQSNSDEVLMNVNKQFLDDKLSVDGNFGVNNNKGGNRNLIGDVNIEYKLSDDGRYKLKGFNRTNDNTQIITSGGLYTQGMGFFFREEFNSFDELYKRYLKKLKKDKKTP